MSKKGFTLIELVVVIGIIVLFCGFSIITIATIPQTRMKKFAEEIKYNFELARDFSKTHGGTISLYIKKTNDGLELVRDVRESNKHSDYQIKSETIKISDSKIELFYTETNGDGNSVRLGSEDKNQLEFQFSQTDGTLIGPDFVDYMTISNGNKTYKLVVVQRTGQLYFDYEIDDQYFEQNAGANDTIIEVELPCFIDKQQKTYTSFWMDSDSEKTTYQPPIRYDSRYVKISGVYRATGPKSNGMYVIYFDLKDPNGCKWKLDGAPTDASDYTSTKTLQWNINS